MASRTMASTDISWEDGLFLSSLGRAEDCPPKTGPYQDYPYFRPSSLDEILGFWKKTLGLIGTGLATREIGIYIHWPFCPSQCSFCHCSMKVPSRDSEMRAYADALKKEMDAFSDLFQGVAFGSVYIGGGTPTFMPDGELSSLLSHIRSRFRLVLGAQFYVETSPATLTESKLKILVSHGVNRVTLGVQSLDDGIVAGVNRVGQSRKRVSEILRTLSAAPLIADVDLMMGLAGQSSISFLKDLSLIAGMGLQVIHLYGYDARAQTLLARSGIGSGGNGWKDSEAVRRAADQILKESGYQQSNWIPGEDRLDPLEERQDGSLRKFGASVLGFGSAAKSHAFGSCWYEHRPIALEKCPTGEIPPYFVFQSELEDEMWQYAVRNLSRFHRLDRSDFQRIFRKDVRECGFVAEAVANLERSGAILVDARHISWKVSDILARQVFLRGFYSPRLVSDLLARYGKEYATFRASYEKSPREIEDRIRKKATDFYFQRVYYRGVAVGKSSASEGAHAVS